MAGLNSSMRSIMWIMFCSSSTVQTDELIYAHLPRVKDYYAFHCTLLIREDRERNDQLIFNSLSFNCLD